MHGTVLGEITALEKLSLVDLRQKYAKLFPEDISVQGNKPFLKRRIAYRLQEVAFGGLAPQAQQRLQQLIQQYDPINRKPSETAPTPQDSSPKPKPLRDRRLPISGTVLTKVYKGVSFQVKTLLKGFEFQGKTYRSLTAIAKVITGLHWNGYLFFGL